MGGSDARKTGSDRQARKSATYLTHSFALGDISALSLRFQLLTLCFRSIKYELLGMTRVVSGARHPAVVCVHLGSSLSTNHAHIFCLQIYCLLPRPVVAAAVLESVAATYLRPPCALLLLDFVARPAAGD